LKRIGLEVDADIKKKYQQCGFRPTDVVNHPRDATCMGSCIKLSNGVAMPVVGYGTFKMKGKEITEPLRKALDTKYVLLDSAQVYENEKDIGQVLMGRERESYFIETKLWRSSNNYERCLKATKKSISQLKVKFLDMYLIHWPGCKSGWPLKAGTTCPPDWKPEMRLDAYRAMEDLYLEGKIRSIGVSNFSIRHMEQLLEKCRIVPHVLQVEFHPKLIQSELHAFCQKNNIVLQAYASMGSGDTKNGGGSFFTMKGIPEAAKAHNKTPAQILLRWGLEKGVCILPKSCNEERIKQNTELFDFKLTKEEIELIDSNNSMTRSCWKGLDPDTIE